ncbi:MAG: hypothetical protein ACTSPN_10140 [Promethearchaeota archaeon]
MNWLIKWYYTDCSCTGEVAEDGIMEYYYNEQAEWLTNEQGPWQTEWLIKYELSQFMSMFGIVMALVAVSVVKRLDIVVVI